MNWEAFLPAGAASVSIIVAIAYWGGKLVNLARDAKRDVEDLRSDVLEMKPKVDMILVLQQSVADGKAWMERIERRLDRLEVNKGGGS